MTLEHMDYVLGLHVPSFGRQRTNGTCTFHSIPLFTLLRRYSVARPVWPILGVRGPTQCTLGLSLWLRVIDGRILYGVGAHGVRDSRMTNARLTEHGLHSAAQFFYLKWTPVSHRALYVGVTHQLHDRPRI